jgi:hypothetical protein
MISHFENMVIEMTLQFLVGQVNTKLLEAVCLVHHTAIG